MRHIISSSLFVLCLVLIGSIIGCLSAGDLLEMAQTSWREGAYVRAIEEAIDSYNRAVEKNKEISDIQNARDFLTENFPLANQYLEEKAEQKLLGSDTEKMSAWKVYQELVDMNKMVRDSSTSSFLEIIDYGSQLRQAKETSAQIQYVRVLELMGQDKRSSYVEAYWILKGINDFLPGYRDIESLIDSSAKKATTIVAFSSQSITLDVKTSEFTSRPNITSGIYQKIEKFIESNDYPQFLEFISAYSSDDAKSKGAHIFVELDGTVWVDSGTSDSYASSGTVTWQRSYGGKQSLIVTKLDSGLSQDSTSHLDFRQSVAIEFYPVRFRTREITSDFYYNRFNNAAWTDYQLSMAREAIRKNKGEARILVWAELEYGGVSKFLETATVDGVEMNIDSIVYESTRNFINTDLKKFVRFQDMDMEELISEKISENLLFDVGVNSFLANLGV